MMSIKEEQGNILSEDPLSTAEKTSRSTRRSQFADSSVLTNEDLGICFEEEGGSADASLDTYCASFKHTANYHRSDKMPPVNGIIPKAVEFGGLENTFQRPPYFPNCEQMLVYGTKNNLQSDPSMESSILASEKQLKCAVSLTKEEDLGICYEVEDESTLVGFDTPRASSEDKEDSHCSDKVPMRGMDQGDVRFGGLETVFVPPPFVYFVNYAPVIAHDNSYVLQGDPPPPPSERPFKCTICSATFKNERNLSQHAIVHSTERPYACTQCSWTFKRERFLERHMVTHSDERPFACTECPSRFKDTAGLRNHSLVHSGEKPYSCQQCPARYKSKQHLNHHLSTHSSERPFACPHCSFKFKLMNHLKSHLKRHSNDRPFSCPHCTSRFKDRQHLKEHLRIHSSERPFACTQCPAAFKSKPALRVHQSIHSGEKQFKCAHCPAAFALKLHLRQHLAVHSDEKPFCCPLCPSKFKYRSGLRIHSFSHSDEIRKKTQKAQKSG